MLLRIIQKSLDCLPQSVSLKGTKPSRFYCLVYIYFLSLSFRIFLPICSSEFLNLPLISSKKKRVFNSEYERFICVVFYSVCWLSLSSRKLIGFNNKSYHAFFWVPSVASAASFSFWSLDPFVLAPSWFLSKGSASLLVGN